MGGPRPALADGHKYAILSVISDRVTLVGYAPATGSHLSKNKVEARPLANPVFDRSVLGSVRVALEHLEPASQVIIIPPTDASLYKIQDDITDPDEQLRAIVGPLQESLKKQGVDQLILVTKERAPTQVMSSSEMLSNAGTLYGVGFYVDDVTSMQNDQSRAVGFIAPYVYVRIRLIDVDSLSVIRQKTITVCKVAAIPANSNANTAWDALTEQQKMLSLMGLVRTEMTNVVPQLMASEQ